LFCGVTPIRARPTRETLRGPVVAWMVDDTGFPKKGEHSVGVTRQSCGQVRKQENCRVAVSLSVATWSSSLPVAYRLYLPKKWAEDAERREQTEVPEEIEFQTKPDMAGSDPRGGRGRSGPWRGTGRRGLWHEHRVSRGTHRARPAICGGCAEFDDGLGTGQAALAGQAPSKDGTTSAAIAAVYR